MSEQPRRRRRQQMTNDEPAEIIETKQAVVAQSISYQHPTDKQKYRDYADAIPTLIKASPKHTTQQGGGSVSTNKGKTKNKKRMRFKDIVAAIALFLFIFGEGMAEQAIPAIILGVAASVYLIDILVKYCKITEPKRIHSVSMSEKSKTVAAILSLLGGAIGLHRFYLGYNREGRYHVIAPVAIVVAYFLFGLVPYAIAIQNYIGYLLGKIVLLFAIILMAYGYSMHIRAFIDFFKILMDKLLPADGEAYRGYREKTERDTSSINRQTDTLERIARLHKQGILTDEEFQTQKANILRRM